MKDTLRSIVEGMEPSSDCGPNRPCPKCRLLALLAEVEQVDLVKKWRKIAEILCNGVEGNYGIVGGATRESALARESCATELAEWLAVNLPRNDNLIFQRGLNAGAAIACGYIKDKMASSGSLSALTLAGCEAVSWADELERIKAAEQGKLKQEFLALVETMNAYPNQSPLAAAVLKQFLLDYPNVKSEVESIKAEARLEEADGGIRESR